MRWVLPGSSLLAAAIVLLPLRVAVAETDGAPTDQSAGAARVLDLTNAERDKAGLPPLTLSLQLQAAAQAYSQVLATTACFEHRCGPIPDFADRDAAAGYEGWTAIGENLAGGYSTPEAVMAGWMASPGHRNNILSVAFTEIGIGVTSSGGHYHVYWAAEFGSREDNTD
jgi:uncharacterized protein YkwD